MARTNLFVPSVGLSNVMSLAPKTDEVKVFLEQQNLDVMEVDSVAWRNPHSILPQKSQPAV